MEEDRYLVADPFRHTQTHHTETQGDLPVGSTGYVVLKQKDTADEIKARHPHFVVTRVPARTTRFTMTMPELPWKKSVDSG